MSAITVSGLRDTRQPARGEVTCGTVTAPAMGDQRRVGAPGPVNYRVPRPNAESPLWRRGRGARDVVAGPSGLGANRLAADVAVRR